MEVVINCTEVNGTVVRVPYEVFESAKQNSEEADTYDQQGAMHFIIATVLVYSILGVFCTLINRIRRLRGKSHENYVHDESISKYLKKEKILKMDGRKMKLLYECSLIEDEVKKFEERRKLIELEKELTSDFTKEEFSEEKKKKYRKKKRDIGSALGKMGASLFFLGSSHSLNTNTNLNEGNTADDNTSQDSQKLQPGTCKPSVVDIETDIHDEIAMHDELTNLTTSEIENKVDNVDICTATNVSNLPYLCSDV